ncbi:hypothetical protein [Legionella longbeachae]|uniref:hypothetical protein n=1 Tax=Legionella longbeachae TaxID=450 RepID=UPI000A1C0A27|nr:hypothetical protein [Legionella longbeachae]ARM34952.1 hypothetical protein B0B39_16170 [Legionella longbeachae]QEY50901.1 hypothetical protein FQU71_06355 [Legionella longbeachae]
METILVLIFISILWGIIKLSSILENIEFELRHGEIQKQLFETNRTLYQIEQKIPDWSTDYTYELQKLESLSKEINSQLQKINDEFDGYNSSSFACSQLEQLENINDKLVEIIEEQQNR